MPVLSDPAAVFFCAGQSNATCTKLAKGAVDYQSGCVWVITEFCQPLRSALMPNGWCAAECTCLSLADKGLQQLCGVERFHNLSVLVLSKNKVCVSLGKSG